MSACTECGWAEPGYSCDHTSTAPGCKLKLMDLSDKIMDALDAERGEDATYDAIHAAIEEHFGVKF